MQSLYVEFLTLWLYNPNKYFPFYAINFHRNSNNNLVHLTIHALIQVQQRNVSINGGFNV